MKNYDYNKLITEYAVQSKLMYCKALQMAKCNQFVKSQAYLREGNKYLSYASAIHLKLFSNEFNKQGYGLLLVKAEDLLMSVELYKTMVTVFIDIYKTIS